MMSRLIYPLLFSWQALATDLGNIEIYPVDMNEKLDQHLERGLKFLNSFYDKKNTDLFDKQKIKIVIKEGDLAIKNADALHHNKKGSRDHFIFFKKSIIEEDDFYFRLIHELYHVYQSAISKETPDWFNEGVAQYIEELAGKDFSFLLQKAGECRIPALESFWDYGQEDLIYCQYTYAWLFIKYLAKNYGENKFLKFILNSPLSARNKILVATKKRGKKLSFKRLLIDFYRDSFQRFNLMPEVLDKVELGVEQGSFIRIPPATDQITMRANKYFEDYWLVCHCLQSKKIDFHRPKPSKPIKSHVHVIESKCPDGTAAKSLFVFNFVHAKGLRLSLGFK